MINPSNAFILSRMYLAYNVEKHKNQNLQTEHTVPGSCRNRFKCEHTFLDDVAMLRLRKIAMAYRPEFVVSPVKDLGCHVMFSII